MSTEKNQVGVRETKKEIRDEIVREAGEQFRRSGYEGTSMRAVADALGISVGNLTYYFQKKEDLLEAVRVEQHKSYCRTPPPKCLEEFDAFFRRILRHQSENAYYFLHYGEMGRLVPKIREMQEEVLRDRRDTFEGGFANLRTAGLMGPDELQGQAECLVQVLVSVCTYGASWDERERLRALWTLIYPLLTEGGKKKYREMA
ncbi:MAG: TetR/AcrR family transcriptional regulator [Clostridia bacterium]|nr:TetR/AcrR family transcriptional regulator [Clostridia bacterium]